VNAIPERPQLFDVSKYVCGDAPFVERRKDEVNDGDAGSLVLLAEPRLPVLWRVWSTRAQCQHNRDSTEHHQRYAEESESTVATTVFRHDHDGGQARSGDLASHAPLSP
jgi:hypothetical protein